MESKLVSRRIHSKWVPTVSKDLIHYLRGRVQKPRALPGNVRSEKEEALVADDRYIRWQGLSITQLSVAVSLISALSVAAIGFGASTLTRGPSASAGLLLVSMLLLGVAVLCSCAAVVARLLDFRLTARKVRKDMKPDYEKPLKIFWCNKDEYGKATWRLFWVGQVTFLIGVSALAIFYGQVVLGRVL